jgi:putative phosphoesterase
MQRVAAIYDIHGNLPALEAVLEDIRRADVESIVVGGDVLPGPMPSETLACLLDLEFPVVFIRGNGDRIVVDEHRGAPGIVLPEAIHATVRWNAEQLSADDIRRVAEWPEAVSVNVTNLGDVIFCHATPRNDTEVFTRLTPEERLLPIFKNVDASVVVCGHTHMQFDRSVGRHRVVNAGSVGMPYGEPGAYWLLLGPDIQLRRTSYDLERAAERIMASGYPQVREFVDKDLLHPRSEREMVELFGTVELK